MRVKPYLRELLVAEGVINVTSYIQPESLSAVMMAFEGSADNEVVTKQYVMDRAATFDISKFTTGTLSRDVLPAFSGQISKGASNQGIYIAVNNPGLTAGWKTKVTVGEHGYVTGVADLTADDIPALSFSKITSGLPTTLSAAGLNGLLAKSGGTVTGNVNINQAAESISYTGEFKAVTKGYVDAYAGTVGSSSSGYELGAVRYTADPATPVGYLRCNGADVSIASYPDLYTKLADSYSRRTILGNGRPWQQQYNINATPYLSKRPWTAGVALPTAIHHSEAIITKNRAYLIGGFGTNGVGINSVLGTTVSNAGVTGSWSAASTLPDARGRFPVILVNNRVTGFGGYGTSAALATTVTAPVDNDGAIGSWSYGSALPEARYSGMAVVLKDRVYYLGGINSIGTTVATVYSAPVDSDGNVGSWTTMASLPAPVHSGHLCVIKNTLYIFGGYTSAGVYAAYMKATINSDGTLGDWTFSSWTYNGSASCYGGKTVVKNSHVFIFGATNSSGTIISPVYAPIDSLGNVGTWATMTYGPPTPVRLSTAIVTSSRVYLVGGVDGTSASVAAVSYCVYDGGKNSYEEYYRPAPDLTPNGSFRLPDYSDLEKVGVYTYIKA